MRSGLAETSRRVIYLLTGPTAVGKTELALRWAEQNNAEIISCDSLLFYRGMDIGTAKPSREELARVPHHLIDCHAVTEKMDITRYIELARIAAESIHARGRNVLVTGGSGFYLKCFFAPVADDVSVAPDLRETLNARLATEGLSVMVDELHRHNPEGLGSLDVSNPRRVQRALERCISSGLTIIKLAENFARQSPPFADWKVQLTCLQRDPEELRHRIAQRVDTMLAAGLIEEVRALRITGLEQNSSAALAIGFRETLSFLDGKLAHDKLAETIAQNTRALVKKQLTWFRTQLLPDHKKMNAAATDTQTLFET